MKSLKLKKVMIMILTVILVLCSFGNFANASIPMNEAYLFKVADCTTNLDYYSKKQGRWIKVICYLTEYELDGVRYPAYCLIADNDGVGEAGPYSVDLTEILDREDIWRAISNGYPYKTPQEMGVDNVLDAYMITKRAVHSLLYDVDVYSQYRSYDTHGEYIISKIAELTDVGRYGSQTREDDTMYINKDGNTYKENNYYTQKFNVSGNIEVAGYTVTATANMPSGAIITNSSGVETNTFNSNESFYVKVPEKSMLSNINALISVRGRCKTYPIYYGKSRIPGTQDYAITYDPYTDLTAVATYNLDVYKSGIIINKIDAETKEKLSGVTYNAKYEDGTNIGDFTTNDEGKITINHLRPDKVILTEIATKDEYILDSTPIEVDLEYNQTKTIELTNEHKKGNLKIYKVDKDNHKITLGNVEFDLYSNELQKVIGTYITNVDGEIEINDLRIGTYKLIEKSTGKWYNLAEDKTVEVKWNITEENIIENELKKGQIKVIKLDKDNNKVKLEGVKFDVLDKDGNILETIVTDENGEALTRRFAIRDYSKITLREKETLESYVLSDETQTITLEGNQIKDITFENERIKGQIEVTKVSSDNNKLTGDKKGTPLEGAIFEVYNSNDELVDILTTNSEGKAISKLLVKGQYYLKEIDSGSPYYLINTDIFKAEIKEHNAIINVNVEDNSVDIDVEVEKKGFVETQSKDSIFYNFKNIKNKSNVALDNFTWQDTLPTQVLRIDRIYTGTWNEDLKYSIWYKTNKNDYNMLVDGLSTQVNNEVSFKDAKLEEDEFITEYEFRFGTVKAGFSEVESPILYCDMLEGLGNGFVFTNYTKVCGNYENKYVEDTDEWTTVTYFKEIKVTQKLPRTGC